MNASLILEVQMPKLLLGFIFSILHCWYELHLYRILDTLGWLGTHGVTVHPWLGVGSVDLL